MGFKRDRKGKIISAPKMPKLSAGAHPTGARTPGQVRNNAKMAAIRSQKANAHKVLISDGGTMKLKLPRGSKPSGGGHRTKHSKSTGRFIG